jgi:tetratricopeptide (TPR) repeat protein
MQESKESGLLEQAIRLGRQRRYREAIPLLKEAYSRNNQGHEALLYLGRSFHALGDYVQALDALRDFLRLRPDSAAGHFFIGRTYLSIGIFTTAADHFRKSLVLQPDFLTALILLGYSLIKLKQFDPAAELLGRAVEKDPKNPGLSQAYLNSLLLSGIRHFQEGDYPYAKEVFEFLRSMKIDHILIHLYLGMIYRSEGNLTSALDAYESALLLSPSDELILYRTAILNIQNGNDVRGSALMKILRRLYPDSPLFSSGESEHAMVFQYLRRKEYPKALSQALELLKKNPRDVSIRMVVAECYRETGNPQRSLNHYTRILEQEPRHVPARFGLAMLWWQESELRKAEHELRAVLNIDPHNSSAGYYLVLSRNREDVDGRSYLAELKKAIEEYGSDQNLMLAVADTFTRLRDYKKAEKWLRGIIKNYPDEAEAYRSLILLDDTLELKDVKNLFETYLNLRSQDISIRRRYIEYLFRREAYAETAAHIEKILPFIDENRRLNRIRAICYRKSGFYERAALLYRQLLREEPHKEEYLRSLVFCLQKSDRIAEAENILAAAIDYLTEPSADLYLIFGVLLFRKGRLDAALKSFQDAFDTSPRDWRAAYNIGEVYRAKGIEDFALRFFRRAEELKGKEKE